MNQETPTAQVPPNEQAAADLVRSLIAATPSRDRRNAWRAVLRMILNITDGMRLGRGRPTRVDHSDVLRRLAAGDSAAKVAEAVGCSVNLVRKIRREGK